MASRRTGYLNWALKDSGTKKESGQCVSLWASTCKGPAVQLREEAQGRAWRDQMGPEGDTDSLTKEIVGFRK